MNHKKKVEIYLQEMEKRGVSLFSAAPPAYRWLWKHNIKVKPPLYQGVISLFLTGLLNFYIPIVILFTLIESISEAKLVVPDVLLLFIGSFIFALVTTIYFKIKAYFLQLCKWENLK